LPANLPRYKKFLPGAIPVAVFENAPADAVFVDIRIDRLDAAQKSSHITTETDRGTALGVVALDLPLFDDDTGRAPFDEKIGDGIQRRRIGAH
jgi:hypothetical protein